MKATALTVTLLVLGAATLSAQTTNPCSALTKADVKRVQGEEYVSTKASSSTSGELAVSQCFYALAAFDRSISMSVLRRSADAPRNAVAEFWKKSFHGEDAEEREHEEREHETRAVTKGREEEEEERPALRVRGIGDEAFWSGNAIAGTLFIRRGAMIVGISVGGSGTQEQKIEKSKALAAKALRRL